MRAAIGWELGQLAVRLVGFALVAAMLVGLGLWIAKG